MSRTTFALLAPLLVACGSVPSASDTSEDAIQAVPDKVSRGAPSPDGTLVPNAATHARQTSADGGADTVGGGTSNPPPANACAGSVENPQGAATLGAYLHTLPYGEPTGGFRDSVVDAILKSCAMFGAPSTGGWQPRFCWAHMASAILKESSFDPNATISDGYAQRTVNGAAANDPTVGLTQIRFSSTVRDFAHYGARDKLACVGCNLPASALDHANDDGESSFWAVDGPQQNMSAMKNVACNVALGTWYYYVNATGNGNPSTPTYVGPYCGGAGWGANLVTGLLTHFLGAEQAHTPVWNQGELDAFGGGGRDYVTAIKSSFDTMVGPVNGNHPFFMGLSPNPAQYCAR